MKKVSCLICAHNEAQRIGAVLSVVQKHPWINEVWVVDDGSSDKTSDIVRRFKKVKLLTLDKNQGKTKALILGLSKTKNELNLLLDADLSGLTTKNLSALIKPVLKGEAGMSLSLRKNSYAIHRWIGLDFSSGERVFSKKLLKGKMSLLKRLPPFGFEVFLNELFLKTKESLTVVFWPNVTHARKVQKIGFWKGQWAELKMTVDLLRSRGPLKIIAQNGALLKRKQVH